MIDLTDRRTAASGASERWADSLRRFYDGAGFDPDKAIAAVLAQCSDRRRRVSFLRSQHDKPAEDGIYWANKDGLAKKAIAYICGDCSAHRRGAR